jgi:hypothetical protein
VSSGLVVRPLRRADLGSADLLDAAGTAVERPDASVDRDDAVLEHLLTTDPQGCWAAEGEGGLVGMAVSLRRELMWVLASHHAEADERAWGPLLEATAGYGSGCLRGAVLLGPGSESAARARRAGFTLHPTMRMSGYVDRAAIPVGDRIREGSLSDVDLLDSVDRQSRGAAHGPDHPFLVTRHRLGVVDRPTGSGYVYLRANGAPALLAATNRRTAVDLLWEALAASDPRHPVAVEHVTSVNEWALDVALAAGLDVALGGYLALRGMRPPAAYLPHRLLF